MKKAQNNKRPYTPGDKVKLAAYLNKHTKGKPVAADVAQKNKKNLIEWLKVKK